MRRFTMLALATFVSLLPATVWGQDQAQSPPNWFRVSWQSGVLPSTIEGQVQNTSPFRAIDVRVQIEGLDAENHILGQRLVWLSDDIAPGDTTSYFSESILGAVGYRVSVASFELVSGGEAVIDAESGPPRPGD